MTIDPFAANPSPAQPEPTTTDTVWNNPEVYTVTDNNGITRISLTFKAGSSFDSPWVVVEGGTLPGVLGDLRNQATDFGSILDLTAKGAKSFQEAYGGGDAPQRPQQRQSTNQGQQQVPQNNGRPQGATEPPEWAAGIAPKCPHGPTYRTGVGKTGKVWHAYDCSQGQCERQWLNPPRN